MHKITLHNFVVLSCRKIMKIYWSRR